MYNMSDESERKFVVSEKLEVLVNFNSRDQDDPCKEGANRLAGADKKIFVALSKNYFKSIGMMGK
jgi:hypothetical protein